jgi:hypothetical protein
LKTISYFAPLPMNLGSRAQGAQKVRGGFSLTLPPGAGTGFLRLA